MSSVTSVPGGEPPGESRPLRRDAERNRLRILDAAREVYATAGLDAGFDEIARTAGVGVGTVYRRFPDRGDLVEALFEQEIDAVVARAEAAVAHPDPWAGLRGFVLWGVEAQAGDRGLAQVLAAAGHGHERVALGRRRLVPTIAALLERARDARVLRPDVTELDLGIVVAMLSGIGTPDRAELRERYVTVFLDGLAVRRDAATPLPPAVPSEADLACVVEPPRRAPRGPVG